MEKSRIWTWLTRMSVSVLVATMLVSTISLVAAPAKPVVAGSCDGVYQGAGSCYDICNEKGLCQWPDYKKYECSARNYVHRKYLGIFNRYEKTSGIFWGYEVCGFSNPKNCPSWCN